MSHLLGASYFTFYDYNISDSARKMFSSYQRKGLAQVCPWNLSTYITVQDVHYHFYKRRSPPVTQNKFLKRKLSKPTGYPRNLITLTLSEIHFENRKEALRQKPSREKTILPFVTQYQPSVPSLKNILMKHWQLIEKQPLLRQIYKEPPIISYKRGRSLKDILVKAKL